MDDINTSPSPTGELALQTVAMPADTNSSGDIFGGWLLSQMDIAGAVYAAQHAEGRVATVAINAMAFLTPVSVGDVVTCYARTLEIGRSSIRVLIEVWVNVSREPVKVTEGEFVFVAISRQGSTRPIPEQ
jgi:acyl-CoA thioesterase YciA